MNIIELRKRDLLKLDTLKIHNKVLNTEGKLYIYSYKNKWIRKNEVLKIYFMNNLIDKKIDVVKNLLLNKKHINVQELVLPTSLVSIDSNLSGFSMPYISNNINLVLLLKNNNVMLSKKIEFLKSIYKIIEKLDKIKKLDNNFFLGDIHESNFIFDTKKQIIRAVDIDSSYINNSYISPAKYLTVNKKIINMNKYPFKDNNPIPNTNTSILCFIYMLLNVLSNDNSYYWSIDEYYNYLNYLRDKNCSYELLDNLSKIYIDGIDNEFNINLLDTIDVKKSYKLK